MSQQAGIQPYFNNHSLRATTVTILSSVNVETRQIKAVNGHKSDASIESYCERPTLDQFQGMTSALTSFIKGKENTPPSRTASSSASESMKGAMQGTKTSYFPMELTQVRFCHHETFTDVHSPST